MADQPTQHMPGGHYSGHNKVPTVRKFLDNLDSDKKERDKQIEQELQQQRQQGLQDHSDVKTHKPKSKGIEGTQKTVTDPTTGNKVVIEDVNKDMIKQVEDPHVGFTGSRLLYHAIAHTSQITVPNANLGKPTVSDQTWAK